MKALRNDPRSPGVKKLAGKDDLYRIREGDYRIIYTIRKHRDLVILVLKIGDRKEVYR
jgi:mRNA interferase RelE/StbE